MDISGLGCEGADRVQLTTEIESLLQGPEPILCIDPPLGQDF